MSGTSLAHSKSSTHGRVLPLIPKAFPEQHCWARPVLGARRQRNSIRNGQAVAASQVGRQPHNSRQSDVIAKKRQQPHTQMQTLCKADPVQSRPWDDIDVPVKRLRLGLARSPHRGKGDIELRDWPPFILLCSHPCLFLTWFRLKYSHKP